MPIPLVTRVLVADDHALVREGVKRVLDHEPDLRVEAEAADGAEAVERALDDDIAREVAQAGAGRSGRRPGRYVVVGAGLGRSA